MELLAVTVEDVKEEIVNQVAGKILSLLFTRII